MACCLLDDRLVMDLVAQYLRRTVDENCLYTTVEVGISLGCPLSPVMAAIYLEPQDRRMEATGLTYARFIDGWVILAPTRWALRRAVVIVNETLRELRVEHRLGQDVIFGVSLMVLAHSHVK